MKYGAESQRTHSLVVYLFIFTYSVIQLSFCLQRIPFCSVSFFFSFIYFLLNQMTDDNEDDDCIMETVNDTI